jgi:hypothetical protein
LTGGAKGTGGMRLTLFAMLGVAVAVAALAQSLL